MEVEKIRQNAFAQRPLAKYQSQQQRFTPNFTGGVDKFVPKDFIRESLPASIGKMEKLEWLRGELGGILITALGTGLVAPIFIGFNPFVRPKKDATPEEKKEVRNTKIYTAWRQPISAVLAILFQASILKSIDKFLDNLVNKPENAKKWNLHINHSELNTESYLKTLTKREFKEKGIKKPSYFKAFSNGFNFKAISKERDDYEKMFDDAVKAKSDKQVDKLAKSFLETGDIKIAAEHLDYPTLGQLVNKQADKYIEDAEKLLVDQKGMDFYVKRSETLVKNEAHLKEIFKDIPYKEIKEIPYKAVQDPADEARLKDLYKQTENKIKDLIAKEKNPEVKELLTEILEKPEDIRASRASRTLDRIESIKQVCGEKGYSPENYRKFLERKNVEINSLINKVKASKINEQELSKATKEVVNASINKLTEACKFEETDKLVNSILHDTDTFSHNAKTLSKKIHKDIIKLYKDLLKNEYKSVNQISKIAIGVCITLPITCNVLNWVYPRFMEIVFPNIAGAKKSADAKKAGGDK